jgi:hypothetical protein
MDLIAGLKQGGKKKIGTNEACELEFSTVVQPLTHTSKSFMIPNS